MVKSLTPLGIKWSTYKAVPATMLTPLSLDMLGSNSGLYLHEGNTRALSANQNCSAVRDQLVLILTVLWTSTIAQLSEQGVSSPVPRHFAITNNY